MKQMKKILFTLVSVILVASMYACNLNERIVPTPTPVVVSNEKEITVIFDMTNYEGDIQVSEGIEDYTDDIKVFNIETKATKLEAVLDELVADNKITYSGTKSAITGIMITEIDNITLQGNQFFAIYTNDTENSDTNWGTYTYEENTLGSASWGATSLPVKDGYVYAFSISSF